MCSGVEETPADARERQRRAEALRAQLLRWSSGRHGIDAAVRVMITSRWVEDAAFTRRCVVELDQEYAVVDWLEAERYCARLPDDVTVKDRDALETACGFARVAWERIRDDTLADRSPEAGP